MEQQNLFDFINVDEKKSHGEIFDKYFSDVCDYEKINDYEFKHKSKNEALWQRVDTREYVVSDIGYYPKEKLLEETETKRTEILFEDNEILIVKIIQKSFKYMKNGFEFTCDNKGMDVVCYFKSRNLKGEIVYYGIGSKELEA